MYLHVTYLLLAPSERGKRDVIRSSGFFAFSLGDIPRPQNLPGGDVIGIAGRTGPSALWLQKPSDYCPPDGGVKAKVPRVFGLDPNPRGFISSGFFRLPSDLRRGIGVSQILLSLSPASATLP